MTGRMQFAEVSTLLQQMSLSAVCSGQLSRHLRARMPLRFSQLTCCRSCLKQYVYEAVHDCALSATPPSYIHNTHFTPVGLHHLYNPKFVYLYAHN